MPGDTVEAGRWVRVYRVELAAGERAPGVPADTADLPFESWVNGRLLEPSSIGEPAAIETASGRRVSGRLVAVDPGYTPSFGSRSGPLHAAGGRARDDLFGSG